MFKKEKAKEAAGKAAVGIKSGFGRTRQKLLANFGRADSAVDLEAEEDEDRFEEQRELVEDVEGEIKKFWEAANEFAVTQRKLADDLLAMYEASAGMYNCAMQYQTGSIEVEKYLKEMLERVKTEVLEPLKEYADQYKQLQKRFSLIEDRRVDMDRFYGEYLQALQKPGFDERVARAAKETYEEARDACEALTSEATTDARLLYRDRASFFDPLAQTMIDMEHKLMQVAAKAYADCMPLVTHNSASSAVHAFPPAITDNDHSAAAGGTDYLAYEAKVAAPSADAYAAAAAGEYEYDAGADEDDEQAGAAPAAATAATAIVVPPAAAAALARTSKRPAPAVPVAAPAPLTATALYKFDGAEEGELPFAKGDVLTILTRDGEWWQAQLNGKTGDIPANYVKLNE